MNRSLFLGIAIFLAVVGIALLGGEKQAEAGHGCHGVHACAGAAQVACDGVACHGRAKRAKGRARCAGACVGAHVAVCDGAACHGRARRVKCHGRARCAGAHACNGVIIDGAPLDAPVPADEAPAPPPPAAAASYSKIVFVR